jgi:hypothetical protein
MVTIQQKVAHHQSHLKNVTTLLDIMDPPERDIEHEFSGSFQTPNRRNNSSTSSSSIRRVDIAQAMGASISPSANAHHTEDYSHSDSAIPIAVQRKIGFEQHHHSTDRPKRRNFWADVCAWVKPDGHDVAPDWAYSQSHRHADTIPEAAVGVAPDWAYRH